MNSTLSHQVFTLRIKVESVFIENDSLIFLSEQLDRKHCKKCCSLLIL